MRRPGPRVADVSALSRADRAAGLAPAPRARAAQSSSRCRRARRAPAPTTTRRRRGGARRGRPRRRTAGAGGRRRASTRARSPSAVASGSAASPSMILRRRPISTRSLARCEALTRRASNTRAASSSRGTGRGHARPSSRSSANRTGLRASGMVTRPPIARRRQASTSRTCPATDVLDGEEVGVPTRARTLRCARREPKAPARARRARDRAAGAALPREHAARGRARRERPSQRAPGPQSRPAPARRPPADRARARCRAPPRRRAAPRRGARAAPRRARGRAAASPRCAHRPAGELLRRSPRGAGSGRRVPGAQRDLDERGSRARARPRVVGDGDGALERPTRELQIAELRVRDPAQREAEGAARPARRAPGPAASRRPRALARRRRERRRRKAPPEDRRTLGFCHEGAQRRTEARKAVSGDGRSFDRARCPRGRRAAIRTRGI